jgi:hypothetical protein
MLNDPELASKGELPGARSLRAAVHALDFRDVWTDELFLTQKLAVSKVAEALAGLCRTPDIALPS